MEKPKSQPVTSMSLINEHLRRLDYTGYDPRNRTTQKMIIGLVIFVISTLTFFLEGLYILTNKYTDFGFVTIDIMVFTGYWQLCLKLYALIAKHESFLKLINTVDHKFWNETVLPESEEKIIQKVYKIAKLATRSYDIGIAVTFAGHLLTSYFRGKESLICNIWMPEELKEWNKTPIGHHVIFLAEVILMASAIANGLIIIDEIFIIFIAVVIAQLKIIKSRFLGFNPDNSVEFNMKQISENIDQHNIVFDVLYSVEEIFSTAVLHVSGTNIIVAALSLYCIMVETDIGRIIAYAFMFASVTFQIFIYCIMGQLIINETASVSDTAYMSRWQDIPDKNIRLSLMLVIQRSQKVVKITMGGFFILCLETFTNVSKMMFSLLTFMMNFDVGKS